MKMTQTTINNSRDRYRKAHTHSHTARALSRIKRINNRNCSSVCVCGIVTSSSNSGKKINGSKHHLCEMSLSTDPDETFSLSVRLALLCRFSISVLLLLFVLTHCHPAAAHIHTHPIRFYLVNLSVWRERTVYLPGENHTVEAKQKNRDIK